MVVNFNQEFKTRANVGSLKFLFLGPERKVIIISSIDISFILNCMMRVKRPTIVGFV